MQASSWKLPEATLKQRLRSTLLYHEAGKVTKSLGLLFEAHLPAAAVGSLCEIVVDPKSGTNAKVIEAEVVGFRDKRVLLMPFEEAHGVNPESLVILKNKSALVKVGPELLGRVLDGRGVPMDDLGDLMLDPDRCEDRSLYQKPTSPLSRQVIDQPLSLGVRAMDGLLTCGRGQRMGIMAGSGVGKSVLLGMLAKNTEAEVNVIALIGERGREVREFIERDLGPEGMARSVVIVSTSDTSPLVRMRGAFLASTVAEYFRDQGKNVLLLMDSVTRFCMAQRQIGLAMGEPPASKGYTPSVFSTLPKLLERAGMGSEGKGSITGIYTVLVEGDDMDEPIADAARSFLDGHIVLSRKLAQRNHYPAIDVLQSTSRVMNAVIDSNHKKWATELRTWMALYSQVEDLINLGAYVKGANPKIDQAVVVYDRILEFLKQPAEQNSNYQETLAYLQGISRAGESFLKGV
jgi:flagellum-specific ATP synthase